MNPSVSTMLNQKMLLLIPAAMELAYLETDQPTERKNTALHGAAEPALSPEVGSRQDVGQTHNAAPHAVRILHVPDELELSQRHVMIQAVKGSKTKNFFMRCSSPTLYFAQHSVTFLREWK